MTELRNRRATVYIGSLKLEGFRVAFSVKKSTESNANSADCSVWGLNESSRSTIEDRKKPPFIIDAGYQDLRGIIFSGEAVRPSSTLEPDGWVTRIHAADGHSNQRAILNTTLGKGTSVGDVVQTIADKMGVASKNAVDRAKSGDFDGAVGQFSQGITLTGSAKSNMDQLAQSLGVEWSIQDGELVVLKPLEVRAGEAVVLSPETGLLGSPQLVLDEKRPGKRIVRLRSLLNPRLAPGVRVSVRARAVQGVYKASIVTHAGDTFSPNAWVSQVEAVEVVGATEV